MALRNVLHFPNPRLRLVAKPVEKISAETQQLIDDMLETMYAEDGIGLAATQIDVHERVIVMDVSPARNDPRVFINPEILEKTGDAETAEGCLSVPGVYDKVKRSETITLSYLDKEGHTRTLSAEGLLAICIQHEIDHLNGKLFIDRLSRLKRERIEKKYKKLQEVKF